MFGRFRRGKTPAKFILVSTSAQEAADPGALDQLHVRGRSTTQEHKAFLARAAAAEQSHPNVVLASRSHTGTQQHKVFLASTLVAHHPYTNSVLADALKGVMLDKEMPLPEINLGQGAADAPAAPPREGGPAWQ